MRRTLPFLVVGCWAFHDLNSSYELRVRGAVTATARGGAESGPTGTAGEPYYTIALGGPDGKAAVVFTRTGSAYPQVGVYRVGELELDQNGFSGLIITGTPAHPTGVFRVQSGTLTITTASPEQLEGRFELRAAGFLTEWPTQDGREITADGSFAAGTRGRDTILTLTSERRR